MKYLFWSKKIGLLIAKKQGFKKLNISHWRIIFYIRFFYFKYNNLPNVRNIINFLNNNYNIKYDSFILFKLFPKGIIKQSTKIACLSVKNIQCF